MSGSSAITQLIDHLPSPSRQILSRAVKAHTLSGSDQGLLAACGPSGRPLLSLILEAFDEEITQAERRACKRALAQMVELAPAPLLTRPAWGEAPLNAWLFTLLALPAGRHLAPQAHPAVLDLAYDCLENTTDPDKLRILIKGAVAPLMSLTRQLDQEQSEELSRHQTNKSVLAFFTSRLENKFGAHTTRFKEYRAKLKRLFGGRPPRYGGERISTDYGPRKNSPLMDEWLGPNRDPDAYEDLPEGHPARQAFSDDAKSYQEELSPDKGGPKKKEHFAEPFPTTQFVNPTPNTPGVPSLVEVGIMLGGCSALPTKRAVRARLMLLAAVGVGWTRQLQGSGLGEHASGRGDHPGLTILGDGRVNIQPKATVGRPDWYDQDRARHTEFTRPHIKSLRNYSLTLHPALSACIQEAARYAKGGAIFPGRSYQGALADLNTLLQNTCPGAAKVTPGRLGLLFQGLANSWDYSWAMRYTLCGRAMAAHEMAINYTLVSLAETTRSHWTFINQLLEKLLQVITANQGRLGAAQIPHALKPTESPAPRTPGYTGSWSTPDPGLVSRIISFTQAQQARDDLLPTERHNWTVRLAAFSGAVLMAMRPYAVDNLKLSPRQALEGRSFAQQVKRRPGEAASWVERHVPSIIQEFWWQALRSCAAVPHQGGLPCLLTGSGKPRPFSIQRELDFILAQIGHKGPSIRAYGLRHLGRTLLSNAGLPDTDLALVLNHWRKGFERHNMMRLGADLAGFPDRYNKAALTAAKQIGLEVNQSNLSQPI